MSGQEHARHVPVMCAEVVEALQPADGGIYVDGTFGAGGYTRAILEAADCRVFGIDRDPDAIVAGEALVRAYDGRLVLKEGPFSTLLDLVRADGLESVDGVTLDLGVSSMQLDEAGRGFSFRADGPLDMRMDQGRGTETPSAAEVVNSASEGLLVRIISVLGEEKRAKAVARAIIRARDEGPITGTLQLAQLVERAVPVHPGRRTIHPATRTFQALRIFVNRELEELANGLAAAEELIGPGGRLAVVSFHSLEDRIVKRFFAERTGRTGRGSRHMPEQIETAPSFREVFRGAREPGEAETLANPRSRSARLRVGERTEADPFPLNAKSLGVPIVPEFPRSEHTT
ncbi:MAG: 16S rRNA (cytosine(1402)-N(4))-methyltransferase RsmH [Rhizobiales bacterium]|nr:16S rRNA (cytosine(1402)-N(4))-methyltransferase RsmH [Hyphomicrobiales bacterium]